MLLNDFFIINSTTEDSDFAAKYGYQFSFSHIECKNRLNMNSLILDSKSEF